MSTETTRTGKVPLQQIYFYTFSEQQEQWTSLMEPLTKDHLKKLEQNHTKKMVWKEGQSLAKASFMWKYEGFIHVKIRRLHSRENTKASLTWKYEGFIHVKIRRLHSCENTKGSKKLVSKEGWSLMRTVFQQGFQSSATSTVPCFLLRPQAEKLHSSSLTSSSLCSSGSEWGRGVVRHGWLGSDWSVAPAPLWTLSPSGAPSPPETCVTLVCLIRAFAK